MTHLLCRNRVKDFEAWKELFDDQLGSAARATLKLTHMWRNADDPDEAFFLFEVGDKQRAMAFLSSPENEEIGRNAGVVDGDFWFVKDS